MIQEYFFLNGDNREEIMAYNPQGIVKATKEIKDTSWVIEFISDINDEKTAGVFSDVHEEMSKFNPITLTSGCSEYYNKILYPKINDFERKLRKLIYLVVSASNDEKAKQFIQMLEDKDFGEIFDFLFVDTKYIANSKIRVNGQNEYEKKKNFTKNEIIDFFTNSEEKTTWNSLWDENAVPDLTKKFREIHGYRNDVMHAHNIGKAMFGKARYLFDKVNRQLEEEISKRTGEINNYTEEMTEHTNRVIDERLREMDLSAINNSIKVAIDSVKNMDIFSDSWDSYKRVIEAEKILHSITIPNFAAQLKMLSEEIKQQVSFPYLVSNQIEQLKIISQEHKTQVENKKNIK